MNNTCRTFAIPNEGTESARRNKREVFGFSFPKGLQNILFLILVYLKSFPIFANRKGLGLRFGLGFWAFRFRSGSGEKENFFPLRFGKIHLPLSTQSQRASGNHLNKPGGNVRFSRPAPPCSPCGNGVARVPESSLKRCHNNKTSINTGPGACVPFFGERRPGPGCPGRKH